MGEAMSAEIERFKAAQRAYDNAAPHDCSNPDCPECGAEMSGEGNKWEWEFSCPKCGFVMAGDNFPDKPDPYEEF